MPLPADWQSFACLKRVGGLHSVKFRLSSGVHRCEFQHPLMWLAGVQWMLGWGRNFVKCDVANGRTKMPHRCGYCREPVRQTAASGAYRQQTCRASAEAIKFRRTGKNRSPMNERRERVLTCVECAPSTLIQKGGWEEDWGSSLASRLRSTAHGDRKLRWE